MRGAIDDLLSELTLLTIAAAIALGYAVLDVAQGTSALVVTAFADPDETFTAGPLTLEVVGRVFGFGQLVAGLVELALVLTAILYVVRSGRRSREEEIAE